MKKILILFLLILIAGCSDQNSHYSSGGSSISDDLGNKFKSGKEYNRIITLAPNLTEFVYLLGLQNKLVGNTLYCNYPEDANRVEKVGDMLSVDYEKIITLKPDLIFITVEGNAKGTYDKLKELGFNVFVSNPRNFEGIKKTLSDMSELFNLRVVADSIVNNWNLRLNSLKERSSRRDSLRGMFAISFKPLMLAGMNTFMNEYLSFNGIKNIASSSKINYPIFSREEIYKVKPEIIITSGNKVKTISDILDIYPEWNELPAIKNGMIININPDLYFRPGPRFIDALEDLSNRIDMLYGNVQLGSQ